MNFTFITEALILGISTGAYCLFSCAPMVTPIMLSNTEKSGGLVVRFLAGRLIGYLLVGVIAGITGSLLTDSFDNRSGLIFKSVISIVTGIILLTSSLVFNFPKLSLCRFLKRIKITKKSIMILGLVAGINICPPFIAAVTRVLNTGGHIYGILFFLVFFTATSLYFLPYIGSGFLTKKLPQIREISRISLIIIGLYILIFRGIISLLEVIF